MESMPRPRPIYLSPERSRHGRLVWYFRKDGKRIRIKAEFGSPEFKELYAAALTGQPLSTREYTKAKTGSVRWLYDRYRETSAWAGLSPATRRQRENIFKGVIEAIGSEEAGKILRSDIEASKDARRKTPAQARNFLDAMRGMFRWALAAGHVKADPTAGVTNPKRPPGAGFTPWMEADIAVYEARWAAGTRQRVWL